MSLEAMECVPPLCICLLSDGELRIFWTSNIFFPAALIVDFLQPVPDEFIPSD